MLELRPTCEHCDKALPPASPEARICSCWARHRPVDPAAQRALVAAIGGLPAEQR